jgi:hypothetical protein
MRSSSRLSKILVFVAVAVGAVLALERESHSRPGKGVPFAELGQQLEVVEASVEDEVLRAWSRRIDDGGERFVVLADFDDQAVLDRETQLVWARTPDATKRAWITALSACYNTQIGGRGGWRAPQMEEITTLVDRSTSNPPIPAGHPFDLSNLTGDVWSATTVPGTDTAWTQDVRNDGFLGGFPKDSELNVLCVRGGRGIEGQ